MVTNLAKLKSAKGTPPPVDTTEDVIAANSRDNEKEPMRPLQVRIPESVFVDFSERAGREFGFTHGAKKQLFLKMWEAYKAHSTKA